MPAFLPSLTGLRFYAALLVVLYHYTSYIGRIPIVSEFTLFGRSGVTFFFVLSGFVLTWSYWGRDTPLRVFYWRRFARIWPLQMVTTFFTAGVLLYTNHSLARDLTWGNLWPAIPLIHTWFPDPKVNWGWNGATWSLSDEAFFYAIFPAVVVFLALRGRASLFAVPVLMTLVSLGLWLWIPMEGIGPYLRGLLLDYFPLSRVVQFIIGIGLACLVRKGWRSPVPLWTAVSVVLGYHVILYLWSEVTVPGTQWYPYSASQLFAAIPFAILIGTIATRDLDNIPSHLATPTLVLLGQASFAWYLLHGGVALLAVFWIGGMPTELPVIITIWLLAGISSQVLSIAVYKWFEHPVERKLRSMVKGHSGKVFNPGSSLKPTPSIAD